MYKKIFEFFQNSDNSFKGAKVSLVQGDSVIDTKTLEVSNSKILLKKPKRKPFIFSDGDLMQLHIQRKDSTVYPVKLVSNEQNTLAFELL